MEAERGEVAGGKQIWIRGHEIIVTTSRDVDGSFYAFALLTTEVGGKKGMKGFKATGESGRQAELACLDRVLRYIEERAGKSTAIRTRASRNLAAIRGREVDIFCDLVGEGTYQAFPFLFDANGERRILLRFHLEEAVTAGTPEEARLRCVRRLESYFDELDDPARNPGPPGDEVGA